MLSRRSLLACIPGAAALAAGLFKLPMSSSVRVTGVSWMIDWTPHRKRPMEGFVVRSCLADGRRMSRADIVRQYGEPFTAELDRVVYEAMKARKNGLIPVDVMVAV